MCSHFGACFYWQLRRRLAKAHLVITNQAMLLADARTDGNVLPSFHAAVIDEAHNLVDVATNAYSHELTRRGFMSYYRVGVRLQNALGDRVPSSPGSGAILMSWCGRQASTSCRWKA